MFLRTEIPDEEALDTEVFIFLSILQRHGDGTAHVVIGVVDRQFDFLSFAHAYFVVLLFLLRVELDVDLDAAGQPAEE